MLTLIDKSMVNLFEDDPVRPHLIDFKKAEYNQNYVWIEDDKPQAVLCVSFTEAIPSSERDLQEFKNKDGNVAVFYTVWSYSKGAGCKIVLETFAHLKKHYPHIDRFVTLSPLTEMARKFHIRNGAKFLNKYATCQNFEYE